MLRAGYGVNYTGALRNFINVDGITGTVPGVYLGSGTSGVQVTPASYTSISTLTLPIAKPVATAPTPIPVTDRSTTIQAYDMVAPYTQNWNLEVQREIVQNTTVEIRYIGTKGTKLWGGIPLNNVEIFTNGILDAFNVTRAGGDAPLFTQMLTGINIGGGAGIVNGTTVTGSQALRVRTAPREPGSQMEVWASLRIT